MKFKKGVSPAGLSALAVGDIENFLAASTEGGIEAQEAAGQADFVQSQSLPAECPQADLEALGFVFGVAVDDLFVSVTFPDGWQVKPTDHAMWNDLIDEQGRKRGGIFYKAAFYDRSAHMRLNRRFQVSRNYDLTDGEVQVQVIDGEKVIFSTRIASAEKHSKAFWALEEILMQEAQVYLTKHYPDHNNCNAYWQESENRSVESNGCDN